MPTAGAVLAPNRRDAADRVGAAAARRRGPLACARRAASAPQRTLEIARVGIRGLSQRMQAEVALFAWAAVVSEVEDHALTVQDRLGLEERDHASASDGVAESSSESGRTPALRGGGGKVSKPAVPRASRLKPRSSGSARPVRAVGDMAERPAEKFFSLWKVALERACVACIGCSAVC